MTMEAYPRECTLGQFTNGDFFQAFDWWALSPRNVYFIIQLIQHVGLQPTVIWFLSSDTIPEEDCRVFVLRRRSDSHLSRPILSHQVIYSHNHAVIPSYRLYFHTYIHTFIHSCIYTFMHTHTYKNHSCIDHPESCFHKFPNKKKCLP